MLAAQPAQQRDDLRLHRDVERGGGLVGDDQLGLGAQRERDHHALAHAAGELVRVVVDALRRRRDADLIEERERALAGGGGGKLEMGQHGLDQLLAHRVQRVQAGERVLEDHRDAAPAQAPHGFAAQLVDGLAVEQDLAAGDAPGRLQQADDGRAGERLARARLAHHAEHLAARDVEGDVVERQQGAAPRGELHPQAAHRQQRQAATGVHLVDVRHVHRRSLGLSASRSQSPSRFTDSASSSRVRPGKSTIHHSPENR